MGCLVIRIAKVQLGMIATCLEHVRTLAQLVRSTQAPRLTLAFARWGQVLSSAILVHHAIDDRKRRSSGIGLARRQSMAKRTNNPAPHAGEREAPAIPKDGTTPGMGAPPEEEAEAGELPVNTDEQPTSDTIGPQQHDLHRRGEPKPIDRNKDRKA
jgi:hypothetical protein